MFISQHEGENLTKIIKFYENMSENHLLTILGHELTHHSDLFVDEFENQRIDGIWFEEGMCDYLARKFLLNDIEFKEISIIEFELVKIFKDKYGVHSLDTFGSSSSYQGSLTNIMFDYWRSFLSIKYLVEERANHKFLQVFNEYHKWHSNGRKEPLVEYFNVEALFDY